MKIFEMFKFKETFVREYNNECAKGIIRPANFHRQNFIILGIFQVLDAPIRKYTYFIKAATIFCAVSALIILSLGFYHGVLIRDIPFITEVGTYAIVMSYKIIILMCTKLNVYDYHQLQHYMGEDFLYACTKGERYRKRFFYNQIFTRKICNLTLVFTTSVALGMISIGVLSLLFHLVTHSPGEGKRPLLFPFWCFSVDFRASPVYEIIFFYSCMCISAYAINYTFMIVTEIMWIREIATKADIVIWSIRDLLDGIEPTQDKRERALFDEILKKRLSEIVKHHQSMHRLLKYFAKVYKKLLMFEQKISAPVVCLSAYSCYVTSGDGEFNAVLLLLFIAAIILLFIPSYLCTVLSMKVSSICYACWDTPFWNASPVVRPYLVLIMQRSLRPLPLTVPGFEEVSVQTFSKKMASAYSMFNMLRQINI